MPRKARSDARQPQPSPQAPPARPAQQTSAEAARANAGPSFPFARTAEDDELRDLSGYGWGV
jgi:hypothetical protein